MKKILLHVPHSSTHLPSHEGYLLDKTGLQREMDILTDWHTDELFASPLGQMIKAPFSRIFCDPERFTDDAQEVMSRYGMGVLYEKTDSGEPLRQVTPEFREQVLQEHYWPHHHAFSAAVEAQLQAHGKALILDCHSYPDRPLTRDLDQSPQRPDFNIGTDAFHTPRALVELSKDFFESRGYSLGINWPYKGSIVPMTYYGTEKRVQTLMLEINRKLYLQDNNGTKSKGYEKVRTVTADFIKALHATL